MWFSCVYICYFINPVRYVSLPSFYKWGNVLKEHLRVEWKRILRTEAMLHKVLFNYQFFCAPQLKQKLGNGDFPSFPVVKNLPYNAGDAGLIPGWGTKIPHAMWQLSPRTTTTELARLNERACVPQTTEPMHSGAHVPQLQSPRALEPAHHN